MPVLLKEDHRKLLREFNHKIDVLRELISSRELKDATEGVKGRGHWATPDLSCATIGKRYEIRMAVESFKLILAEFKRLK